MEFTCLQWQMLLHYHAVAEPYAFRHPQHAQSEAVQDQRSQLIKAGLLERWDMNNWPSGYKVTDKGRCLINHICNNLPTPVSITEWRIPN